jgi:predicted AAA+ superfamily ATPase
MFKRAIEPTLLKAASKFPITVLTGPRQSGKTTLLKYLFPEYSYTNLEAPDTLLRAQSDPRGFLLATKNLIIDEAQNFPEIFSYIQEYVDTHRDSRFILSGSQNFLLAERVSQTLAGRAAILELLPLMYSEYLTDPVNNHLGIWEYLFDGSYPRPYHEHLDIHLWYNSYIRTYLERDVRSLINVKDLAKFQLFLKMCAGWHGQLLNLSTIAQNCGISQTTATEWLSILEASYIVFRLRPYYRNFKKRLVKTSKLYFYDSAIVCMLLGIRSVEHLKLYSNRGAIFEGFVLTEIMKMYAAQGKTAPLYFWRDHQGNEVDGLIEQADNIIALEIKAGMTFLPDFLLGLKKWQSISNISAENSYLIYAGDKSFKHQGMQVVSWKDINLFGATQPSTFTSPIPKK